MSTAPDVVPLSPPPGLVPTEKQIEITTATTTKTESSPGEQAVTKTTTQRRPPTYQESVDEAAQATLAKSAKLDIAERASDIQDKRDMLGKDRYWTQRFRRRIEAHTIGADVKAALAGGDDDTGDLVVCDDVNHVTNHYHQHPPTTQPQPTQPVTPPPVVKNGVASLLKGAALGAALLGTGGLGTLGIAALSGFLNKPTQQAQPEVEKQVWRGKLRVGWDEDGDLDVDVLDKDGNPVEGNP